MKNTFSYSDHLTRFIERIYEIKESHNIQISQAELKATALEMGLTDFEWDQMQDLFTSHFSRAMSYHKYKNWDDAISELDQALTINPFDEKTLFLMSSCYANRYYEGEEREDREKSILFANKTLEVNPLDQKALQLLSSLKKEARQRKIIERESIKTLVVACSFGAIIFTALAYLSFSNTLMTSAIPFETARASVDLKTNEFTPDVEYQNASIDHENSYFYLTENVIKVFERKAALVLQGKFSERNNAGVSVRWKDIEGNIVHSEHFTPQYLNDIKDPINDKFKLIRFLESEKAIAIAKVHIVID
ncbi:hypothetical protein [Flammeovirga kamogawensis]|uniref:Tetratricopeptide repeat protein n=1 Tax=Flammeovirga kamogawensis TaxID=373891 RepID=A0ABX8GWD6_9BACT|nr:hypothetical protein [Flammeovirga kamogawensis]MBB6460560.1 tetratricopeptide (TPR) repeat protein [Flammeovirga kamogawensis]QWG07920.1 hypothetical protein KM029_03015 [Flammeovirga kamogawensis]TRX69727.1 hypothetical protein EO216_16945 [Flammeovirga kamogawensis]